jgi:hypothetical protein
MGDFFGAALLNRDMLSIQDGKIERSKVEMGAAT